MELIEGIIGVHPDWQVLKHCLYALFVFPGYLVFAKVISWSRKKVRARFQKSQRGTRNSTMAYGSETILLKEASLWLGTFVALILSLGTEVTQASQNIRDPQSFADPLDLLAAWVPSLILFFATYKIKRFYE